MFGNFEILWKFRIFFEILKILEFLENFELFFFRILKFYEILFKISKFYEICFEIFGNF
jgi:hypothetical protein